MGKTYKNVDEYLLETTGKVSSDMTKQEMQNVESAFAGYKQKNNLQDIYESAVSSLDKNLQTDQRTAYFNNEKLMKYLPNELKVQGLQNNVGAVNQAYIDANNNYQTNLNALTKNYNESKTNMLNDYNTNVLKIDESVRKEQNENNKYWQELQDKLDAEQRANDRDDELIAKEENINNSANQLSTAIGLIGDFASTLTPNENGEYSAEDIEKIKDFIEKHSLYDGLSENDKKLLDMALAGYIQEESDDVMGDENSYKNNKGEKFTITGDESTLNIAFGKGFTDKVKTLLINNFGSLKSVPNGYVIEGSNQTFKDKNTYLVYYNGKISMAKLSY